MFLEWKVETEEDGLLLRTFLKSKHISKQLLTAVKFGADGKIEVNNEEQNVLYHVKVGDKVRLTFPTEQQNERLLAEYTNLDIVFEDDFLLIINKPAGWLPFHHNITQMDPLQILSKGIMKRKD